LLYLEEVRRIKDELSDIRRDILTLAISSIIAFITRLVIDWKIFFGIIVLVIFKITLTHWYRRLYF